MAKVDLQEFLSNADSIAAEKPSYQLGHDGSDGKCDCIGYAIGSIRRSGGTWSGIHGSNYAARNETEDLTKISGVGSLAIGEIVYKASEPGQSNYNLPSQYENDADQRDYYHAGIVRSVNPLRIVHCTGPGIVTDTKLGKWNYHGWLKKVGREGGVPMANTKLATVVAENGSTVNMRKEPDGALLDRVPVGAVVTIIGESGGWSNIMYGETEGWMKSSFLRIKGEDAPQNTYQPTGENVNITLPRELAEQLRDALTSAVGWG